MMSLNNVHEPRNAEFTAFLGSFLVEWQSNDNNFGNYFLNNNRIIIKKFNNSHRIILEFSMVIYGILFSKIPQVVFRKILKDS